jgi:hypothetical protein
MSCWRRLLIISKNSLLISSPHNAVHGKFQLRQRIIIQAHSYYTGEISGSHGGHYEEGRLPGCSTVWSGRRLSTFQGYFRALMIEAASTLETSVKFYQTTRRNNTEDTFNMDIKLIWSIKGKELRFPSSDGVMTKIIHRKIETV